MSIYQKRNKLLLVILILVSTLLQTGCAFKDIDKRTFVIGIGIDPGENDSKKYKVTLKIALPVASIKQATSANYAYLSHESDSVSEAIRILETHIDRVLDFGHAKFIMFNKDLLSNDLKDFMDYFIRRGDIPLIAWMAAATPSAEYILKTEPPTESPVEVIYFNFFGDNGTESPFITSTHLFEFRRDVLTKGIDSVLPLIETNEDKTELIINKSVVVKNKQDPFELTAIQTKYYNTLTNDSSGFGYLVKKNDFFMLLTIQKIKMKYKIVEEKGQPPRADIKIKAVGIVVEASEQLSEKHLNDYNTFASNEMKEKFMALLTTLQKKELDPFGFGLRYRATRLNDKNTFSKWEEQYPDLVFDIDFKMEVKSLGSVK